MLYEYDFEIYNKKDEEGSKDDFYLVGPLSFVHKDWLLKRTFENYERKSKLTKILEDIYENQHKPISNKELLRYFTEEMIKRGFEELHLTNREVHSDKATPYTYPEINLRAIKR